MEKRIHNNRKDLAGEHKAGDAGQAILGLLFLIFWITDTFFLGFSTSLNMKIPAVLRIISGSVVLIIAGYFCFTGLKIVFGEIREKPTVIRKSVFGIVRHPVYLGEILFYLGFLLFSVSLISVFIWICMIGFLHYISKYEEKLLLDFFGEEYRIYMKEVPRWMPKFRIRKNV